MKKIYADLEDEALLRPILTRFLEYLVGRWTDGRHVRSEWNFWDQDEHLTNNAAEGGNWRLFNKMKTKHPSVYKFFSVINSELETTSNVIDQTLRGRVSQLQRATTKMAMKTRKKLKEMYERNEINRRRFMRSIGALYSKLNMPGHQRRQRNAERNVGDVNRLVLQSTSEDQNALTVVRGRGRGRPRGRGRGQGRGQERGRRPRGRPHGSGRTLPDGPVRGARGRGAAFIPIWGA